MKQIIIIFLAITILNMVSCGDKPNVTTIDPHNRTLINIPLGELKSILSGNWLLKKEKICGFAPCYDTIYNVGQEDILSFLPLDSVKRVKADATVLVYDKAVISKSSYDNSWVYSMAGGLRNWSFQEIKNDTLIGRIDWGQGSQSYLVKKP